MGGKGVEGKKDLQKKYTDVQEKDWWGVINQRFVGRLYIAHMPYIRKGYYYC